MNLAPHNQPPAAKTDICDACMCVCVYIYTHTHVDYESCKPESTSRGEYSLYDGCPGPVCVCVCVVMDAPFPNWRE